MELRLANRVWSRLVRLTNLCTVLMAASVRATPGMKATVRGIERPLRVGR